MHDPPSLSLQAWLMRDPFDMTTIILAALAIFVLWKLWSVLGSRSGTEKPPSNPFAKAVPRSDKQPDPSDAASNVIRLPGAALAANPARNDNDLERWKGFCDPGSAVWAGLDSIAAADAEFAVPVFLKGAKAAYEMIIAAFAAGDQKTLKNLLAKDVFESFSAAIRAREQRGETVATTFVSLDKAILEHAQFKAPMAQISVRFQAKLISVTRGRDASIIDGSAESIVDMVDIWTFARDIGVRDPNWRLIATETGQ